MKLFICLVISCFVFLSGCVQAHNPDPAHNSRNALDWPGVYHGVLPCADCTGIDTTLTLNADQSFVKKMRYLGKSKKVFESAGRFTWIKNNSSIHLKDAQGRDDGRFQVGENRLFMLDQTGQRIQGALEDNYILEKKSAF